MVTKIIRMTWICRKDVTKKKIETRLMTYHLQASVDKFGKGEKSQIGMIIRLKNLIEGKGF